MCQVKMLLEYRWHCLEHRGELVKVAGGSRETGKSAVGLIRIDTVASARHTGYVCTQRVMQLADVETVCEPHELSKGWL